MIAPPSALRTDSSGFTLVELLIVLALAAIVLGAAWPLGRRSLDRLHVVTAREELFGLVYRARGIATRTGSAMVTVDVDTGRAVLVDGRGREMTRVELGSRRVAVATTGSASTVALRWNGLGWGVLSSRTLVLRRGEAEARLVVSSRGRASRR
jgi:prepilin-type N-terminal cleavage/methylation domain-containing protein